LLQFKTVVWCAWQLHLSYGICEHFPDYGLLFLSFDYSWPRKRNLISAAWLEAIPAINRLAAVRLKGNLSIYTAACANGIKHLALWTAIALSTISPVTILFCRITAGLTFPGRLKSFRFVELLFFSTEGEICTTSGTMDHGY
jgi:hypothetical protein